MAQNSANAIIARTGALYVGPQGSVTAPTSHNSALDSDLKEFGYISSDGLDEKFSVDSESVTAFQNGDTIDSSITKAEMTFETTLIEPNNIVVVESFYGATVDTDDGSILISPGATSGRKAMVIDMVSGLKVVRYWLPEAEITKNGDVKWQNGKEVGFPIKITCYPSSSLVLPDGTSASAKRWSSQLIVP